MNKNHREKDRKYNGKVFLLTLGVVLVFGGIIIALVYRRQNLVQKSEPPQKEDNYQEILKEQEMASSVTKPSESGTEVSSEPELEFVYEEEADTILLDDDGSGKLVISFAGDVLFDDGYATMNRYRQNDSDISRVFIDGLLEYMNEPDLFMVNNEFTFSERGEPLPDKMYTFRGKPENVSLYKEMGVDLVGMANNHITDYGTVSLYDTLDTLDNAGIVHVGAGRNLDEASRIQYYRKGSIKIGIVCATQIERLSKPDTQGATEELPGTFRCLDPEAAKEKIKEAKENADFVIFYVHWGTEREEEPDWLEREQVQGYVDAGADAIIGGHPHILQKIGYAGDSVVFYSLGNFWFSSKTTDTGIATLTIDKNGLEQARFVPCVSRNCVVELCGNEEKNRILNHMRMISEGVLIDNDGYVTRN